MMLSRKNVLLFIYQYQAMHLIGNADGCNILGNHTRLFGGISLMACFACSHHMLGDCSAQPVCSDFMGDSTSGYCADAIDCCVARPQQTTLTDEVPISIPNNSINLFLDGCKIEKRN
jgi:hypothetical protein